MKLNIGDRVILFGKLTPRCTRKLQCWFLAVCTIGCFLVVLHLVLVQPTASPIHLDHNGIIQQNHNGIIHQDHNGIIQQNHNGVIHQDHTGVIHQNHNGTTLQAHNVAIHADRYVTAEEESTEVPIVGWEPTRNRDIRLYVFPDNETAIIPLAGLCPDDLFLLVFVSSAVAHLENREVIRQTWASINVTAPVKVLFMLGDPRNSTLQHLVEKESKRHGDIIQENFVDSYYNTTIKVLMMFKWVDSHCSRMRYLLKADDDTFVQLEDLVSLLRATGGSGLLMGLSRCASRPFLEPGNKWYSPRYLYNATLYPPFLLGGGYVMSADVVRGVYRAALDTPFFHLDDVFITGICPRKIRISPRDHGAFILYTDELHPLLFCDHTVVAILMHSTPENMTRMWDLYKATELYCPPLIEHKDLFPKVKYPTPRRTNRRC